MDQAFTLDEARGLMPEVLQRADELVAVRADLVELQAALAIGESCRLGGLPEAKGLQARLSELLGWFPDKGLDLKGFAPLLLDFPAVLDGEAVLLCWLEGEPEIARYHRPAHGFAGRPRPPPYSRPETRRPGRPWRSGRPWRRQARPGRISQHQG